jgi:hypothetical protein
MTAVEFLFEKYKSQNTLLFADDFTQAEELFKQQIEDAHVHGHNAPSSTLKNFDAEQYYKETYIKSDKS